MYTRSSADQPPGMCDTHLASLLVQWHAAWTAPSAGLKSELFKGGFLPKGDRVCLGEMMGLGMVSFVGTVHSFSDSGEPANIGREQQHGMSGTKHLS